MARDKRLEIRVSQEELDQLSVSASSQGLKLAEYVREKIFGGAKCIGCEKPIEKGSFCSGACKAKTDLPTVPRRAKEKPVIEEEKPTPLSCFEDKSVKVERKPLSATGWWNGNKWFEPN